MILESPLPPKALQVERGKRRPRGLKKGESRRKSRSSRVSQNKQRILGEQSFYLGA